MSEEEKKTQRAQRLKTLGLYLDDILLALGGVALVTAAALAFGAAAAFGTAGICLIFLSRRVARAQQEGWRI